MNASDTYRQYQDARDAAWRTLLRFSVRALPADVFRIAKELGIAVHPHPLPGDDPALPLLRRLPGPSVCRTLLLGRAWHVYFLAPLDESRRRFALAHELGHVILRHEKMALRPGVRIFKSSENAGDLIEDPLDISDYAADIFAIRLLAPACVLHEMHIDQPGRIAALCGMPPKAAALRGERMELLNARNAFFSHPLERQVRDQFLPFIRGAAPPDATARSASPLTMPLPEPPRKKEPPPVAAPAPEPPAESPPPEPPSRFSRGFWIALGAALLAALLLLIIRYA